MTTRAVGGRPLRNIPLVTRRQFCATASRRADFTHAVIGGGVVGLAVARALASHPSSPSTVLIERRGAVGTETSSRNSEVIHAGLYYGASALKTDVCIRGRQQLYALCEARSVPFQRTGKWIVAQNDAQAAALGCIHDLCAGTTGVPVRWVGRAEAARREPDVRADAAILESPTTGIVDSHTLMTCLLGDFENAGGTTALSSAVCDITPLGGGRPGSTGWEIRVRDGAEAGQESVVTADSIVNAAGLGAVDVHNMIVPPEQQKQMYYAKGNYFSYGSSQPRVRTLIYPAPEPGLGGLGTHLTLDLGGRVRFGPDVEWVDSPHDLAVSAARLPEAVRQIRRYLPGIDASLLAPDYAGIRPKLSGREATARGEALSDFIVRKEDGYEGWVNLLNIESPGLTSCLAIADRVKELLYSR